MSAVAEQSMKERVEAALQKNPKVMTLQLAREWNVPEAEIIANLPAGRGIELDATKWEELFKDFEPLEKVHVICTNTAVTLEAFGQFGNFSTWGDFFNVQTATLDMHIQFKKLARIFAVEKPGHMDGVNTQSFQFFDAAGNSVMKVFLTMGGKIDEKRVQQFSTLRQKYQK